MRGEVPRVLTPHTPATRTISRRTLISAESFSRRTLIPVCGRVRGYRRSCASLASRDDDNAGRDSRPPSCCALSRNRIGLATPLCHRHCRRPFGSPALEHLPATCTVRVGGPRRGQIARTGGGFWREQLAQFRSRKSRGNGLY